VQYSRIRGEVEHLVTVPTLFPKLWAKEGIPIPVNRVSAMPHGVTYSMRCTNRGWVLYRELYQNADLYLTMDHSGNFVVVKDRDKDECIIDKQFFQGLSSSKRFWFYVKRLCDSGKLTYPLIRKIGLLPEEIRGRIWFWVFPKG